MFQTIIAYIIIGVALGYTIYSIIRILSRKNVPSCGGSCEGCSIKKCSKSVKI
ncbi:MAG: FeoB-associated Cys-rich membrane protein [Bacteroidales bacterium]|nr:FeoB-associated Cys-rich membrane protein [Bacteroidales bacterium]